jgi:H/ACA ribonucleoprotein complex subunit 3
MKTEILKCNNCNIYTLERICKNCKSKAITPKPAKYSPEDKYGHYRRLAKKELGEL